MAMVVKFLWGVIWRTTAFCAVAGTGLWWFNRAEDWSGDQVIASPENKVQGRAGLVVVALMQPERFEPKFFENFLDKLFTQVIPWPVNVLAGADSGVVLIDPTQPYMLKRFTPRRLADIWGREADVDGIPWVEKYRRGELRWEKPSTSTPHDPGVWLYPARKQGMRFAAAKTAIKARYIYYPTLPDGVLPHFVQTRDMALGGIAEAKKRYPIIAGELADAFDPYQKEQAVTRVLDAGVDTLILTSTQPIYSRFEELEGSFRGVHKIVEQWRKKNGGKPIRIVIPPYIASQPAFDKLMLDHFAAIVPQATASGQSAMGIATLHGLPVSLTKTDSWSGRVAEIEKRLKPQMAAILKAKGYTKVEAHIAPEGFADTMEDPDDELTSVNELYRRAQKAGMVFAVAVPLEFLSENTDNLFAHSALMFDKFPGYRTYQGPPANTDWNKPYIRRFKLGNTTTIYAGSPGGDTLPRQSLALADAIGNMFK